MEEKMHKGRDPLPMLAINNLSYEDLDQQYDLQGITFNQVDSSVIKKASETFPEQRDDVLQRCQNNLTRQKSETSSQKELLIAEITVTHGLFIDEMYGLVSGKEIT